MAIWHENTQDLWEIPLSEGWHRHSRTFPMPQDAAVAHSIRRAMPISQARLPCQQQTVWTDEWRPAVPHFPIPDLRYYRTPEDLSSPKGEGKYGEPKETDCLFVFVCFCQLSRMETQILKSNFYRRSTPISYWSEFLDWDSYPKSEYMYDNYCQNKSYGCTEKRPNPGQLVMEDLPEEVVCKLRPTEQSSPRNPWCLATLKGHWHLSFLVLLSRWIQDPKRKYIFLFRSNTKSTLGTQNSVLFQVLPWELEPVLWGRLGQGQWQWLWGVGFLWMVRLMRSSKILTHWFLHVTNISSMHALHQVPWWKL